MPRIVNFSDRNARIDNKKQNDTRPGSNFFGMKPSAPAVESRPEVPARIPEVAAAPPIEPIVVEELIVAPVPEPAFDAPVAPAGTITDTYLLSEQILAKSVPDEVVSIDGIVNFDQLFLAARIPVVTVNAEHATHILESLPTELPLRVKHLAVRTSLNVMSDLVQESSVAANIVNDAAQKMLWVARLQENLTTEIETRREDTRSEIAMLEAQIAEKRVALAAAENRSATALKTCRHRTTQLNEVMDFFDRYEAAAGGGVAPRSTPVETPADEEEELPPHLRDDSVFRLLGLHENPPEDEIVVEVSSPVSKIAPDSRNGARRH